MCLHFSTGCRFSNLDPRQVDSPRCRPPDIQIPHCFNHKRSPPQGEARKTSRSRRDQRGCCSANSNQKIILLILFWLVYPLLMFFLFTNNSGKLNVHVTFTGGPNVVTCEQCMLSSCLNPQYNVCSFVVLQRPPYLMM